MKVRMECQTGWPMNLRLRSRISAFTQLRRCDGFKIGITGNPQRRASQYPYGYDEMVVLYKTSSQTQVRKMEKYLTEVYLGDCDNSVGGGGGLLGDPPYYLYIVLSHVW